MTLKVFRFGQKKKQNLKPEDEWLRLVLLEAQEEELKTVIKNAAPPYPHTSGYLYRENRRKKRILRVSRQENRSHWQQMSRLVVCLVLVLVLAVGGGLAVESICSKNINFAGQDVTFQLSGLGGDCYRSSRFGTIRENGNVLQCHFKNTSKETCIVTLCKEGWLRDRKTYEASISVLPGETGDLFYKNPGNSVYFITINSNQGGNISGSLQVFQSIENQA